MVTLSVIKADTGGFVGHTAVHPQMVAEAEKALAGAADGLLLDGQVAWCGDDLALILVHTHGVEAREIHAFAWEVFTRTTRVAEELGMYAAGQDLLSDAFSGNLRGMGPGYAELEFEERTSEPIIVFLADKTEAGAWNLPVYKMFADPFNTAGLVIDPKMHEGFRFEVLDLKRDAVAILEAPGELYDLLLFIGAPSRFVIRRVFSKTTGEIGAVTSTQRLSLIAGRYVGKDDPVLIVRCQSGMPAVGEVVEPFAMAHTVAGCMRGSHHSPLMPVSIEQAHPTRFDGPPRVVSLGFQLKDGKLHGPRDLFADPSFDRARDRVNEVMDYLRSHGPFEPHRLPLDEMEYTTMPAVVEKLEHRWEPVEHALPVTGSPEIVPIA
ncbi:MAG TPA: fructose-1,6-bisphosphate aldolase/phosphatase [Actinomycetota bacterium]|nr:fructose-1,6-bisphosphate aldolase/phosphatase [Actinomycetota bacterium]